MVISINKINKQHKINNPYKIRKPEYLQTEHIDRLQNTFCNTKPTAFHHAICNLKHLRAKIMNQGKEIYLECINVNKH